MKITINGSDHVFESEITVESLLAAMEMDSKGKAVAVNNRVVPRVAWAERYVADGDRVTIITAAYGG